MRAYWEMLRSGDTRHRSLAVGRSLLALAQLETLLATPGRILFLVPPGSSDRQLTGIGMFTLWNLTGSSGGGRTIGLAFACLVLGAVALGFRPRWTCIPHWYVSFSIVADVTVIDGGDQIAGVVTLLLIPVCLGDRRTWAWLTGSALSPGWQGAAGAGILVLRLQVVFIYLEAALSKVLYPVWRNGTAMRVLATDPQFGFPSWVRGLATDVLSPNWAAAAATWSVLAIEIAIAVCVVCGPRIRRLGRALTVCLHAAIIVLMGLFSFGIVMIALAWIVCAGTMPRGPAKSNTGGLRDHIAGFRPVGRVGRGDARVS